MNNTTEKKWTIKDIENITEDKALEMASEHTIIKGHDIYFIDFSDAFGYSCIVFWEGRLIRYAGDYELHHHGKTHAELKEWYIKCLKDKLYTEKELAEPLKDYGDYQRRQYYLHNYYGDHEPHESQFQIFHSDAERQAFAEKVKDLFYNPVCFGYYESEDFCKHCIELEKQIEKAKENMDSDFDYWYKGFRYEFGNFECIYGGRYDEAAAAVLNGMKWNEIRKKAYHKAKADYEQYYYDHDM
jgi:hypothetical protein